MQSPTSFFAPMRPALLVSLAALILAAVGCSTVPGNYPPAKSTSHRCTAILTGAGFRLEAGPRIRVEKVEAELGHLRSQGFSRHDPQIIGSVARRSEVPPGILADRSGTAYYRMTARLDPGVTLTLAPGALEMTVETETGASLICDQGYLLEDRRRPEGCRLPSGGTLVLAGPEPAADHTAHFLARLPVRGEILEIDLVPGRFRRTGNPCGP